MLGFRGLSLWVLGFQVTIRTQSFGFAAWVLVIERSAGLRKYVSFGYVDPWGPGIVLHEAPQKGLRRGLYIGSAIGVIRGVTRSLDPKP